MPEDAQQPQMMTREDLLTTFKNEGITTLEELIDSALPEVGGFMLSSSFGIKSTGTTTQAEGSFIGPWYAYIVEDD